MRPANHCIGIFNLPTQQSAWLSQLLPGIPVALQLFDPHVRLPAQSESSSQSPCPTLHWLDDEQHPQSVDGIPSQFGDAVGAWVVIWADVAVGDGVVVDTRVVVGLVNVAKNKNFVL